MWAFSSLRTALELQGDQAGKTTGIAKYLEAVREMGVRRQAVHDKRVARYATVVKLHSLLLVVCKCF